MDFRFEMATRLHFGPGKLSVLADEARSFGIDSWLLVTDSGLHKLGTSRRVVEILAAEGLKVAEYAGIDSEPTDLQVSAGMEVYRKHSCRGVVALGGGSALDAGKAIAVMANNEGQISDYQGFDRIVQRKAPLIAIPTTAGTGSEVTRAAGITDTSRKVKIVIIDSTLAPEVAIDDPQLTLTLPPSITAHTGIDALSHAIEAYVSRQGNPISDALSLESIRLIGKNLPTAWRDPENLDARTSMMLGQFIAGMAVMNAQVCLVHGMSRPLGAYFHIPHGMGNAMLLPVVMRFNVGAMDDPGRYARMAEILTDQSVGSSDSAAALAAVDRVEQLCRELQIPALKDLDIDRSTYDGLIPQMAEDCLASGSPGNNPIQPSKEQVMELYRTLWEVGG